MTASTFVSEQSLGARPSRRREDRAHERVIVEADPPLLVFGEGLERFRELLDDYARAHEAVEGDAWWRATAISTLRN